MMKQLRNLYYGKAHALCAKLGMSDEDRCAMLVATYGVSSMKDMKYAELLELVDNLTNRVGERTTDDEAQHNDELDTARKRLIAAIGAYLRENGSTENIDTIKAVACRAAKVERFNQITLSDLKFYTATFNAKTRDLKSLKQKEILRKAMLN